MTAAANSLRVGGYELGERIGAGRLSRVYRANAGGQDVAIKLLSPDAELDDPSAVARFQREVAALASINHDNIVSLIDHGVDDELGPYLVMPLLTGVTLREIMVRGRVEPRVAAAAMGQLAAGLAALHRAGLVHRDLKPENIIACADGRLVIIDLGLAWTETQTRHTEEGAIAGSVPYMAPEQIERHALAPCTDLWALAIIGYEWIAGERPFARQRPSEEVAAILSTRCQPLGERDPRVEAKLGELISSCLRRNMAERPRDGAALADALVKCAALDARAALRDPFGVSQRLAAEATETSLGKARHLLAHGKAFEAAAQVERAAAHSPGHPAVMAMAEAVGRAPVRSRRSLRWLMAAGAVVIVAGVAAIVVNGTRVTLDFSLPPLSAADVPEIGPADEMGLAALRVERHEKLFDDAHTSGAMSFTMTNRAEDIAKSDDDKLHYKYARSLLSQTRRQEGLDFLDASLEKLPNSAELWNLQGYVSARLGRHDHADKALGRAIELDPTLQSALRERGELRRLRGQLRAAYNDLTGALELDDQDPTVLGSLVRLHVTVGRGPAATPLARRATELLPHKAQPFLDLASTLPTAEAIEHLETALRNEPLFAPARYAMCIAAAELDHPRAESECVGLGIPYYNRADVVLAKVRIYEKQEKWFLAQSHASTGTRAHPNNLRLWLKRVELEKRLDYYSLDKSLAKACELGDEDSCSVAKERAAAKARDKSGAR